MPFIPGPANAVRLSFEGLQRTEPWAVIMHAINTAPPLDQAQVDSAFVAFKDEFVTILATYAISDDCTLERLIARNVTATGGLEFTSTNLPATGATAGPTLTNETALCISWRTGISGRSFRGRSYLPGVSTVHTDGDDTNRLTSAVAANAKDAADQFIASLGAAGFQLCVASYFSGVDVDGNPIPRAVGIYTPVTGAVVNPRLDSQRRRMPRN